MDNLTQLGQYGLIGVMLALIGLAASAGYGLWKMSCNHMDHSTEAWIKNAEALTKLAAIIELKLK